MRVTRRRTTTATAAPALVLALVLTGCGGGGTAGDDGPSSGPATTGAAPETPATASSGDSGPAQTPSAGDTDLRKKAEQEAGTGIPDDARVVVISVDGLGSRWVTPALAPTISRLIADGAGTRNARTEVEQTETLPNHTGMVTGRWISAIAGGHGVTWNTDTDQPVRSGVDSVFSVVRDSGGSSAVIAGKSKFDLWPDSWPGTIDSFQLQADGARAATAALGQIRSGRDLTFLHLAAPDKAGHSAGWDSPGYRSAVTRADAAVGQVVRAIAADADLADEMVIVVTADHGGIPGEKGHGAASDPANYTIPFAVWGAGVARDDLYALNPDYADPGSSRPSYDGTQPVRNGDVANLVTDLLGLPAVPGSQLNVEQDLTVAE